MEWEESGMKRIDGIKGHRRGVDWVEAVHSAVPFTAADIYFLQLSLIKNATSALKGSSIPETLSSRLFKWTET